MEAKRQAEMVSQKASCLDEASRAYKLRAGFFCLVPDLYDYCILSVLKSETCAKSKLNRQI